MTTKERIREMPLEQVMGERFGRYSKYIIQERALPDIRDGLKPVQRRILYAMYKDNNTYDKPYKKGQKLSVMLWVTFTLMVTVLFMGLWFTYRKIGKCVNR